jgi:dCMP deaminase
MIKKEFQLAYIDTAYRFAELSKAKRLKVGAIAVKESRIISIGYNGTPSGWDNECEEHQFAYDVRDTYYEDGWGYDSDTNRYTRLATKPEVLHAETNCIAKLAKSAESGEGAAMFCTHSPCIDCAKLIYQSGFIELYYSEVYRDRAGLNFLEQCSIDVYEVDCAR